MEDRRWENRGQTERSRFRRGKWVNVPSVSTFPIGSWNLGSVSNDIEQIESSWALAPHFSNLIRRSQ